jgi:hypothetical protein
MIAVRAVPNTGANAQDKHQEIAAENLIVGDFVAGYVGELDVTKK